VRRKPSLPTPIGGNIGPPEHEETRLYDISRAMDSQDDFDELPEWVKNRLWDAFIAKAGLKGKPNKNNEIV
jgi:hypothetical protein